MGARGGGVGGYGHLYYIHYPSCPLIPPLPTVLPQNMHDVFRLFLRSRLLRRYFIDRHTDLERQFNINVDDGKITLAKTLDRETDMWHNITVTATEVSKYNHTRVAKKG